jgi:signal transduction histidine kinase
MINPPSPSKDMVEIWRRRILAGMVWAYFGLGTVACVFGVGLALIERLWSVVAFDLAAWLSSLALAVCPTRFYRLKASGVIVVTYCVGLYFTYRFGPFAAGPFWLFAGPMITGALFGWRAATASLGLLVATLAGIGTLLAQGELSWPGEVGLGIWAVISSSLLALSGMISVSVGVLLDGIEQANKEREDAISARKLLEQQLRHSQKMEAVGRLAGGIAHDFNNLLVAILGFTELAIMKLQGDSAATADLAEVTKAVTKGTRLTQQLLSFTRKDAVNPRIIDLNDTIREADRLLEQLSGKTVEIQTRLSPEPCTVKIDPDAFSQILVNATLNARDAMQDGGSLTLETSRIEVSPGLDQPSGLAMEPGVYVRVSVSDTGEGISADDLEKIFEPFFTTKPPGKGTGLGLSTCWAITNQAGGYVQMQSEPGLGTTLQVYLPESSPPADDSQSEGAASPKRARGTTLLAQENARRPLTPPSGATEADGSGLSIEALRGT